MIESLFAAICFLLAGAAALFGAMAFNVAESIMHEIFGVLLFILSGILLVAAILCSASGVLQGIRRVIQNTRDDLKQWHDSAVSTMREELAKVAASIERIEATVAKPESVSNNGDDWFPEDNGMPELSDSPPAVAVAAAIRVKCPRCGKSVKGGAEWAGRKAKCPGCGGEVQFASS
jgi:hypothetical protein